ncbi:MAG: phosphohistidine phosphatase SixA [Bryobacteraceae bacterium]
MQVYLLRHGIAEDPKPGQPDRERALTAEGRRKLRSVLKAAKAGEVAPEIVVTSPYVRARQTADIARELLGGELVESAALAPHSRPEAAWDELRTYRGSTQVLLVGHEPLFSQLTAYLLGTPELIVDFKKGALARIDFEPELGLRPRGGLRWLITAKLTGAG